jgi:trehalose synthase
MKRIFPVITLLLALFLFSAPWNASADDDYVRWLEAGSMLKTADDLARRFSGSSAQWQHPYGNPHPERVCELAPAWFTAYPASTITPEGRSIVRTLGDDDLWRVFEEIGISAIHTGPLKRSGGLSGRDYTPTVDGGFDRIGFEVAPEFGTDEDFIEMTRSTARHNAVVAEDVIPGHTGKGADFALALRNHTPYPGLYHMIAVRPEDWHLLPEVPAGKDSVNLRPDTVKALHSKGYIVGELQRVIFHEPGIKDTNWSAARPVMGADGVTRRWVYLHYFKEGQPTLNWLDPSFAAQRLLTGDIIKTLTVLGARIIRLDANGFLGVEPRTGSLVAWSEGHPLSVNATNTLAMAARKLGGFTFEELNLSLENLREFTRRGTDLSYDFVTRPAFYHALLTGDGELLRVTLRMMREYDIRPISLIHALQNHDEITYELVHFAAHADDSFVYHGEKIKGRDLRERIVKEAHEKAVGNKAPYNRLLGDGICTTSAGLCAAALGIGDPYRMDKAQKEAVKKAHLLLALYNAMQPGVFALSGWDLVGALPVPAESVKKLTADGDFRWVNRGSYDLMGKSPGAEASRAGLPKAECLYGPLPAQLKDPDSFASSLKRILKVRKQYGIHLAEQVDIPQVRNTSAVLMIHRLQSGEMEVTALNFGDKPVEEIVRVAGAERIRAIDPMGRDKPLEPSAGGAFTIRLGALEGKVLLIQTLQ